MDILYRRFALVVAFIAAMGAMTANLIQETRTAKSDWFQTIEFNQSIEKAACDSKHYCNWDNPNHLIVNFIG